MKPLKNFFLPLACCLALFGCWTVGCTTSQQTTAYNALATIELSADTTYSNYVTLVINGTVPTNSLPVVSKAYNQLHADIIVATAITQAGTNVLAPTNVTMELSAFLNAVATAVSSK